VRSIGAAAAFVIILLGVPVFSPAFAPAPKATSVELYPLRPGFRWVYRCGIFTAIREVTRRDGAWFTMHYNLPLGRFDLPLRHTPDGVATTVKGVDHLLMRFPMTKGERWRIDAPGLPGPNEIADCEVIGLEEIDYLGRKGIATKLRVVRTNRRTNKSVTDYEWYVDGVGLAAMQVTGLRFVLERFDRVK